MDAISARRERLADINCRGMVFDKQKDVVVTTCLSASVVMMFMFLEEVVSHRWKVLLAMQASKMRRRQMMARPWVRKITSHHVVLSLIPTLT